MLEKNNYWHLPPNWGQIWGGPFYWALRGKEKSLLNASKHSSHKFHGIIWFLKMVAKSLPSGKSHRDSALAAQLQALVRVRTASLIGWGSKRMVVTLFYWGSRWEKQKPLITCLRWTTTEIRECECKFSSCSSEQFLEIKAFYWSQNLVALAPCDDLLEE